MRSVPASTCSTRDWSGVSQEIFRTAGIDGEADCIWNDIHWAEVTEPTYFRPCRSCKRCRAGVHLKRIGEAGRAHEHKSLVNAALGTNGPTARAGSTIAARWPVRSLQAHSSFRIPTRVNGG